MPDSDPKPAALALPDVGRRSFIVAAVVGAIAAVVWVIATTIVLRTDIPLIQQAYEAKPNTRAVFRIFFFHVPAAMTTYALLVAVLVSCVGYLTTRKEAFDRLHLAAMESALVLASFVLVSGMIWGNNIWGEPWRWEPRLVAMLVLWLAIVAALTLRGAITEQRKKRTFAAIFGLLVCAVVPFVHWATQWFNTADTLHPKSDTAMAKETGYGEVGGIFLLGIVTLMLIGVAMTLIRFHHERLERELTRLNRTLRQLDSGDAPRNAS